MSTTQDNSVKARAIDWFGEQDTTLQSWNTSINDAADATRYTCTKDGILLAIRVHIRATVTDALTIYGAVYTATGASNNNVGVQIASGSGVTSGTVGQWVSIVLSSPLNVTNGTQYYIAFNRGAGNGFWHGTVSNANYRHAEWNQTAGIWTDNPGSVTYTASKGLVSIAEFMYFVTTPQANSTKGNIKTTYYTGMSYDWNPSTNTNPSGQNRGFNS